jgi:hypothetical protein
MGRTTISTRVAWPTATDDRSGVAAYGLQLQAGAGSWITAVGTTTARSATRTLTFATTYGFRVRARDGAGNWGAFVAGSPIAALRYQDTSSKVTFSRSWRGYTTSSASGGRTHYATRRGAAATFRFTGRAFALIAPRDPWQRGLYVDGVYVSTISLYRSHFAADRCRGTVVVELERTHREAGPGRDRAPPRFDIDAFAS